MLFTELFSYNQRTKRIKEVYDQYNYRLLRDAEFAKKEAEKPHHACLAEWFPKVNNQINVLELGCGPGRYIAILKHFPCHVTGVDPYSFDSWETLKHYKNITLYDNVKAESLPFDDNSFEFIACIGAFFYFNDPERALQEMYRVLKPKGRLLLQTINSNNPYTSFIKKKLDPASNKLYTKEEIEPLLINHNFSINKYFSFGFRPPFLPNFYWYIQNVFLTHEIQKKFSDLLPSSRRVHHIFFLETGKNPAKTSLT